MSRCENCVNLLWCHSVRIVCRYCYVMLWDLGGGHHCDVTVRSMWFFQLTAQWAHTMSSPWGAGELTVMSWWPQIVDWEMPQGTKCVKYHCKCPNPLCEKTLHAGTAHKAHKERQLGCNANIPRLNWLVRFTYDIACNYTMAQVLAVWQASEMESERTTCRDTHKSRVKSIQFFYFYSLQGSFTINWGDRMNA